MMHTFRRAFAALGLGLLLAACSENNRAEFRPASADARSARTTDQGTVGGIDRSGAGQNAGPTPRSDGLLGYVAPSDPHYDITLDEIREHVRNQTAVFIDARGPADFAAAHVRGAFNMPAGRKESYVGQLRQRVAPGQLIIIYCNGPHCDSGDMLYEYLASQGFTNMRVFKPGWAGMASARDLR